MYDFTTLGAIVGLVIAIVLIIKKASPAYSLILGALIDGIIGGGGLVTTVNTMVSGASSMMSSVLRIMTSGILAGALIKTGSAEKIAEIIAEKLGEKRALLAISIATMIICTVGVFVTGNAKDTISITEFGLSKVIGVSILLIGTGTIAGIIKASALQYDVITIIEAMSMPGQLYLTLFHTVPSST